MVGPTKKIFKQLLAFALDQYVVLFFIAALGYKLFFFNTFVTKVTWSEPQYSMGIVCSYVSAAIVFAPLFFVSRHKKKIAVILSVLLSSLLLVDTVYYSYFGALPTVGLLGSLGQTKDIGPAISAQLHPWYVLFFVDAIFILAIQSPVEKIIERIKKKRDIQKADIKTAWAAFAITLIAFWLALLPIGFNTLIEIYNKGYDTVSTSQHFGVLMAHAIDVTRFIKQETTRLSPAQEEALKKWVNENKPKQISTKYTGVAKGKNVIMVQIESLGGFVINQKINDKEITPNLNELAENSHFFPNDRFIYGAGHTSDTDFVSNTSYFPLFDAAVFVRFGQDDFTSLPKTLVNNGYSAYAYHGFNRNFWNRNAALDSLGYQKFYAADNYSKSWKINMGLNDGDFLLETADYIKKQPKPSLSYAITLSSHVPFSTNEKTRDLGVKISDYPDQVGGYLENINFTDRMLGKFFEKLKTEKLYDDSLIIVYGDHTPVLPAFNAGTIAYNPDSVQQKEVPLIIKLPNATDSKIYRKKGNHLNIMPTVLDLLGIKTNQLMFGQSLFASSDKAMKTCTDQLPYFNSKEDCNSVLSDEQSMSALIIRYNQFSNLQKK